MEEKVVNIKGSVLHKRKTEADWYKDVYDGGVERKNPFIPKDGQIVVFISEDSTVGDKLKVGDGVRNVMDLPFSSSGGSGGGGGGGEAGVNYTIDSTSILTLSDTVLGTDMVKKGTGENTVIIQNGIASAKNAIAIGTADVPSDFKTLAGSFTAAAPNASAEASIAAGTSSKAISTGAIAFGVANQAGITGYYWHTINFTNKTITLSTTRPSTLSNSVSAPSKIDWQKGDYICIVNDAKYPFATTITNISGNTITVESLPFTENNYDTTILGAIVYPAAATYAPDDRTIFAVKRSYNTDTQRSTLTPRTGTVQLGWAATVFGAMNIGAGTFSQTFGWQNITAGDFGLTAGRDNTTGYASATFGWNNENAGKQSIIAGKDNKLKRNCANAAGFGVDHVLENDAVFAAGSTHTIKSYAGIALGSSHLVNAYASAAIGLALETNKQGQVVVGQYNKASTMNTNGTAQFVVGTGSSRDATANGLILYKDGRLEIGADPINGKDVVTLDYFNTNKGGGDENLANVLAPVYTSNSATTTGYNSLIAGNISEHNITREYNLSLGKENTISTPYNLVSGKGHNIAGSAGFNLVSGINNIIASTSGYGATIGYNTRTGGTYSIAANYKTNARYKATSAFGVGTVTNNTIGQFVVGRANLSWVTGGDTDVRDALFVVGNGKDDEGTDITFNSEPVIDSINVSNTYRSNAFMVMKDGRAKVGADPKNNMDVATKQYVDSNAGGVSIDDFDSNQFTESNGIISLNLNYLLEQEW